MHLIKSLPNTTSSSKLDSTEHCFRNTVFLFLQLPLLLFISFFSNSSKSNRRNNTQEWYSKWIVLCIRSHLFHLHLAFHNSTYKCGHLVLFVLVFQHYRNQDFRVEISFTIFSNDGISLPIHASSPHSNRVYYGWPSYFKL